MATFSGVTGSFCAAHKSPEGVMHGHSYEVTAWFRNEDGADARCFKAALDTLLKVWDHKELPDNLAWAENIAYAIGRLAKCVEVEVRRPLEGFHARWRED
jgi:6-pyruvoyl-tetrahydropterin synthase